MIVTVIRTIPSYNALTQYGKPGNVMVGGVDVVAHLPYLCGLGFYLLYPLPLMH